MSHAAPPLLAVESIAKTYPSLGDSSQRMRSLWSAVKGEAYHGGKVALNDVSFAIEPGQSLAIIGDNGAGKSTLLKIIAGVLAPTRGTVTRRGSISALLELGAGFHPEYTGRDNLRLAATLAGVPRDRLDAAEAHIMEFADIGDDIDRPVKHYSSGMVVRLGFAVVTCARPDLLITDEIMAVGDESFQRKCMRWLDDFIDEGRSLILVTHAMDHVTRLADSALWLEAGQVRMLGEPKAVVEAYLSARQGEDPRLGATPGNLHLYRITDFALDDETQAVAMQRQMGGSLRLSMEIFSPDDRAPNVAIGVVAADGTPIYGVTTDMAGVTPMRVAQNRFRLGIEFGDLNIAPGHYQFRAHVLDPEGLRLFDTVTRRVEIVGEPRAGLLDLPHRWS